MIVMSIGRRALAVAVAVATGSAVGGCAATGVEGAASDGTTVVASFYPLAYVAERIAGPHAQVQTLAGPGVEPHDFQLSVEQTSDVANADVVVHASGIQPAVDEAVDQVAGGVAVDASEEAKNQDPHFWLDVTSMVLVAYSVQNALVEADPAHEDDYLANFGALRRDLRALDSEFEEGLADCRIGTVVVSHDAFDAYERYGLRFAAINGLSPAAEPSPAHLGELSDLIEREGVTTVFSETLASPELADTLADDLGLSTGVLDPIEGLTEATAGDDYLSLMRANLAAIRKANDCS
jgi:zinc transport system substrate-binding protein